MKITLTWQVKSTIYPSRCQSLPHRTAFFHLSLLTQGRVFPLNFALFLHQQVQDQRGIVQRNSWSTVRQRADQAQSRMKPQVFPQYSYEHTFLTGRWEGGKTPQNSLKIGIASGAMGNRPSRLNRLAMDQVRS